VDDQQYCRAAAAHSVCAEGALRTYAQKVRPERVRRRRSGCAQKVRPERVRRKCAPGAVPQVGSVRR